MSACKLVSKAILLQVAGGGVVVVGGDGGVVMFVGVVAIFDVVVGDVDVGGGGGDVDVGGGGGDVVLA